MKDASIEFFIKKQTSFPLFSPFHIVATLAGTAQLRNA